MRQPPAPLLLDGHRTNRNPPRSHTPATLFQVRELPGARAHPRGGPCHLPVAPQHRPRTPSLTRRSEAARSTLTSGTRPTSPRPQRPGLRGWERLGGEILQVPLETERHLPRSCRVPGLTWAQTPHGPCQDSSRGQGHPSSDPSWGVPHPWGRWDLALLEGVRVTSETHETRHHQPLALREDGHGGRARLPEGCWAPANMGERSPRPGTRAASALASGQAPVAQAGPRPQEAR